MDYRAALLTAGLLLVAIAAQAVLVYCFVALESLEEADRWMQHALHAHAQALAEGRSSKTEDDPSQSAVGPHFLMRVFDREGALIGSQGEWPPPDRLVRAQSSDATESSPSFWQLRAQNHLMGERALADGRRIELAMPLSSFHAEAMEIAIALAGLAALSGVAALVVAGLAISLAFSPLQRATRLIDGLDTRNLGRRLPSRGTGDPVDRHAESVNRLLGEVDRLFERLRSFSADAAHELRTPLNRLQNLVEVALLEAGEIDSKRTLERVNVAAQELSHIVGSLLLLAELEDQRVELRSAALDLDEWLAHFIALHAPLFEERNVRLERIGTLGVLEVDRHLLDRVMSNLLDNAFLHGSSGGRVEVRASREGSRVTIAVDDAGPGIPERMREHVFDRFARLDGARSGSGTGLGLALARACARASGGDLCVGDSQLGGACFVWEIRAPRLGGHEESPRDDG